MTEPETDRTRATARSDQLKGSKPHASKLRVGPGTTIDGTYLIEKQIGQGGMGTVYLARHIGLQSDYAIKMLDCRETDNTLLQRFNNEAKAIAKLNHPNIVKIHNMGVHEQALPYYAMDFIAGETLSQKLKRQGKLTVEESLRIFIQVCSCLSFAHKHEIIHRDIKPANIMITGDQQVKLLDFGLAKFTGSLASQALTATGEVFGSPSYMSPEQALGKKVDERSDIYSTAVALFETLTGALPFSSNNYVQTMLKVQSESPPSLSTASGGAVFPGDLEAVINHALRKDPAQRYQHIDQMEEDLRLVLKGRRPKHLHESAAMSLQQTLNEPAPESPKANQKSSDAQDNGRTIAIMAGLALFLSLAALLASIGLSLKAPRKQEQVQEQYRQTTYSKEPFRVYAPSQSDSDKQFHFTNCPDIGHFYDPVHTRKTYVPDRNGVLILKEADKAALELSDALLANPEQLARFKDNDFDGIICDTTATITPSLEIISRWPHLKYLEIVDAPLSAHDLELIGKLKGLDTLKINSKTVNLEKLATLPNLQTISWFELVTSGGAHIEPVVDSLCHNRRLSQLLLADCNLDHPMIKQISSLNTLTYVSLQNTHIDNADVKELSRLRRLKILNVRSNPDITELAMPTLRALPLDALRISSNGWSAAAREQLNNMYCYKKADID